MSVENPCRIPEKPQLAGKNIAYRREIKLSHLSLPYCFGFLRDQSPRNLLCLGFLGTKPLTIPSHLPRSQEAKNWFTAASCSFFFLLYYIGTLSINLYYWQLTFENVVAPKGAGLVASETSLVKVLVKFKRQQLPFTAHCAHKRHITPEAFPAHFL